MRVSPFPSPIRSLALLLVMSTLTSFVHATVTNVAWYRLGENDPGAASGVTVTNTVNLLGFNSLKSIGSPRYTNAVSPSAANGLGSSLAVHFSGTNQAVTNALVSSATDNFGIEAWVRPNATNAGSTYYIAQNGLNGLGSFAIAQFGNIYSGLVWTTNGGSGVGDSLTAFASPGVWAHVALVRNNGTNRFYFNGATNGPPTTNVPGPLSSRFTIGGNFATNVLGTLSNSFFNGTIDEVRVFTFAPGQFSTNDLLFHALRAATLPATDINPPNATLNGRAHPVGFPTIAWIEWGTTTNYGNVTPVRALPANGGTTNLSETINSAFGGFTYHFRVVASNSLEVVYGADQSFEVPLFADIGTGLTGVDSAQPSPFAAAGSSGFVAWGDYDNDGRLDLLLAGNGVAEIWRNTGTAFTNIGPILGSSVINTFSPSVAWGDYDSDGRLDFALTGNDPGSPAGTDHGPIAGVFRNTGNGFTATTLLEGVHVGAAAWGDYNNDGALDLLLTGATSQGAITTRVLGNISGSFSNINAALTGVARSSVAWGDYDNDGHLDILVAGQKGGGTTPSISEIWRNMSSGFTNISASLTAVRLGSVAWGDYDNDGRLDILLTGTIDGNAAGAISEVWRNTGSGFTNINAGLPPVFRSAAAWGDYDNDGRLDILLTGTTNGTADGNVSEVWRNTGSGFTRIIADLPGVSRGSVAWGDYDNDGRLDILIAGTNATLGRITRILRNQTKVSNTPPIAPTGLTATAAGDHVIILSWNAASDDQTSASGLTYNVRIGTTPGASDVMGPMASSNGLRRLPQMGNANMRLFARFNAALNTPYYWSVQAVDTSFAGGPFAPEQSFTINTVLTPPNGIPVPGDQNGDGIVSQSEFAAVLTNLNGNGIVTQSELDLILSNYFPNSPFLYMTNVAGLGGTNVTFALTNSLVGAFSVEFTTNLADWFLLGPATPRYLFTDTNAPGLPERFYRLRWP